MTHSMHQQSSFAMMFDPAAALAAAECAAKWDLPRRVCRPLDRYVGPCVSADLAAYDAQVDDGVAPDDEIDDVPPSIARECDDDADCDDDF